jgi:hypothetical protein
MKNWFLGLTRFKKILCVVLFGHGFVLFSMMIQHWITFAPPKRKQIAVHTFRVAPPPKQTIVHAPAPKKEAVVGKKQAPKKGTDKPVAKSPRVDQKLVKEIEASLAAVSSPTKTTKQEIAIPTLSFDLPEEMSPAETIAVFLREALQLPEFGEVRVELSIDSSGRLEKLEILESKSEKNAEFLRNQLPELLFPCLNRGVNLTIVFSNDL